MALPRGPLLIATIVFAFRLHAAEVPCVNPADQLAGRAGARSLVQLAALSGEAGGCVFNSEEKATLAIFDPTGPRGERVADGIEDLRFARTPIRAPTSGPVECADQQKILACADRYGTAMKGLENAIAFAAIRDPAVLNLARRLANRLRSIMKARATREVMGDQVRFPTKEERRRIDQTLDQKTSRVYGGCTVDQAGCLSFGCDSAPGRSCDMAQANAMKGALAAGNLRETMFFLYLSNGVLVENASRPVKKNEDATAVTVENVGNIKFINESIKRDGESWSLTGLPETYASPFILRRIGYGADNNGMRDWRTLPDGTKGCEPESRTIGQAPIPSLELIPLSERESAALARRLHVKPRDLVDQPTPYHSGESCFKLKQSIDDPRFEKYNSLLSNTRAARIPMLTGVSGTTDSIMTLGRALGLKTREDFELLRAAALGWLVSSRDHSVHEVMTAASSFKELPPYEFKPDAYKTMLPSRPNFARDVEAYQRAHHLPMPADVLKNCLNGHEASR